MNTNCRNCGTVVDAGYSFCPHCSQRVAIHRLSMHDVFHEAVHYFTHADRGLFVLLKDLLTRTGSVAREYIEGKRKKHFPPLNFYLITAAILLFAYGFQSRPGLIDGSDINATTAAIRQVKVKLFVKSHTDLIMIFALPFTALLYRLFYIRNRFNFTEHLVACMYMIGSMMLVYAIVIIPLSALLGLPEVMIPMVLFISKAVYQSIFYYRFLGKRGVKGALNTLVAAVFTLGSWAVFTISAIALYIYNGFFGLL